MVALQKAPMTVLSMMVHDRKQTPMEPLKKDQKTFLEKVVSMMVHDQQQTPKEPWQKDQQTVLGKVLSMMVLDQVHW